jgi:hypothetical protein
VRLPKGSHITSSPASKARLTTTLKMVNFTVDEIRQLMDRPANIRKNVKSSQ